MSVTITPAEFEATVEKVAKINARAAKKGFTGRIEVISEQVEVKSTVAGIEVTEVRYEVSLGGEAPSYNGWSLAAVLDFDPEIGLVVRTAPGVESVSREGLEAGFCGHCNTVRNRRKAYLVRNVETGEQVQVGSSCIKDFLGWSGSVVFIGTDEVEDALYVAGGMGYSEPRYTPDSVLAVAWACIKVAGWKPSGSFGGTTREDVGLVLSPFARPNAREKAFIAEVEAVAAQENVTEHAAEIKDFILSDAFSGTSEYVSNLKALIAAPSVSTRHLGFVVSAPQAYAKHLERTLVRQQADALPESEFLGQVGDKIEFTGQITMIRHIEGYYGTTVLYVIRNQETGVEVKWFASREALGDKQGVEVSIKGAVKSHDTYQGRKSTVLTRCKAL